MIGNLQEQGSNAEENAPETSSAQEATRRAERAEAELARLKQQIAESAPQVGHYGRLVFAMVSHHFLPHDEVLAWLMRDADFNEEQARVMLRQVEGRDYNPPRRERILAWQREQDFPILPDPDDPDCGNLYRNLKFPDHVYAGIEHYQEAKQAAED